MDGSLLGNQNRRILIAQSTEHASSHGLTARLALTEEDMQETWRLRHDSYVAHGFIEPRADGYFSDKYDRFETARSAIIYRNGMPIASVRICLFDPAATANGIPTMPAFEIFPDLIPPALEKAGPDGSQGLAAEASRMVCLPQYANDTKVIWALLRVGKYITEYFGANVSVIAARSRHVPMYKRIGFHQIGPARPYVGVTFSTALLMAFKPEYENVQKRFPALGTVQRGDLYFERLMSGQSVPALPDEDADILAAFQRQNSSQPSRHQVSA